MGTDNVTVQNLIVQDINKEDKYILVKGAVPGKNKGIVVLKKSIKKK